MRGRLDYTLSGVQCSATTICDSIFVNYCLSEACLRKYFIFQLFYFHLQEQVRFLCMGVPEQSYNPIMHVFLCWRENGPNLQGNCCFYPKGQISYLSCSQNSMITSLTKDTRKSLRNTLFQPNHATTHPAGWNNLQSPGIPADAIAIIQASHLIIRSTIFDFHFKSTDISGNEPFSAYFDNYAGKLKAFPNVHAHLFVSLPSYLHTNIYHVHQNVKTTILLFTKMTKKTFNH